MRNLLLTFIGLLFVGCAASSGGPNDNPDYDFNKRAIEVLKPKCESGNYSACNDLAISYQNLQDHKTALKYYERACKNNYQAACTNLANMYQTGLGVSKDANKALEIYSASCTNGGAYSCYYLGEFYRSAIDGKEPDYANAMSAYDRGCKLGDVPCCTNTAVLYEHGLGVAQDETKARSIYRSACFSGDTSGCDNLKRMGRKR